jgi:hypothetical protein
MTSLITTCAWPVPCLQVDATAKENEEVKQFFKVQGFPTIKIIRGDLDAAAAYEGPRDEAGIVRHLKKQAEPAVSQLKTAEEVASAKADAGGAACITVLLRCGARWGNSSCVCCLTPASMFGARI